MNTTNTRLFRSAALSLVGSVSLAAGVAGAAAAASATAKVGKACAKVGAKSGKGSSLLTCGRTKQGLRWTASSSRATPKATDTTIARGADTTVAKNANPTTVKAGDTTVAKAAPTTARPVVAAPGVSDTTIAKK